MPAAAKYFPAACMAAAMLLQGAAAQSSDRCGTTGISNSRVAIQDSVEKAWLDIGEYACGDQAEELQVTNIDDQVSTVAGAFAEAIAEVTADCVAPRQSTGTAPAEARALAYGEAISRVYVDSEVCGKCTAAVDAISRTSRQLMAEATAQAWTEISAASQAGSAGDARVAALVTDKIQDTVAEVLPAVVGIVRAGANDGCSIDVINEAQVGDYLSRCGSISLEYSPVIEVDAIAEAGAAARDFACGIGRSPATLASIAQAAAHALAEAAVQADVYCAASGGSACGLAETDVEAVAHAQAEAFAEALASAETCGCEVSNYAGASVFAEIWVQAVAIPYAEICALELGTNFESAIEERMVEATAAAITSAIARASEASGGCDSRPDVCSSTSECARRNRVCRGPGISGVLPCCDSGYHCVRRNDEQSRCRRADRPPPSFYDGTIEPPTTCRLPADADAGIQE